MIIKNYELEKNLKPIDNKSFLLLYGENEGQKKDIIKKIKQQFKTAEFFTLFQEEIIKNQNLLTKEINNKSLFSKSKLIIIQNGNDKIFDLISDIIEKKHSDIKIIINSEMLEKKSKLRNLFEKNQNTIICACYEDNELTLKNYVKYNLSNFKNINTDTINLIINNSNNNREIIKNEIEKIKLFALKHNNIDEKEIGELLNFQKTKEISDIVDVVISGTKNNLNEILDAKDIQYDEIDYIFNLLVVKISRLQNILKGIKEQKITIKSAIDNYKPPIFWKEKPIIEKQLNKWSLHNLSRSLDNIHFSSILVRKNVSDRKDVIIKKLLVDISNLASKSS